MISFSAVLPGRRASTSGFIAGLLVLAALDAGRLAYGITETMLMPTLFGGLIVLFLVVNLHMNRLRDVGRGTGMAWAPIGLGLVLKALGSFIGMAYGMIAGMMIFLEREGGEATPQALEAVIADEAFIRAYQEAAAQDPELLLLFWSGGSMPGFLGFWFVILGFSFWFANVKRLGGGLDR